MSDMAMGESRRSEEIEVVMTQNGCVDVNVIQTHDVTMTSQQLDVKEASVSKSDCSTIHESQSVDVNMASPYSSSVMVAPQVVCPEEGMEETIPTVLTMPAPSLLNDHTTDEESNETAEEINQAWFTTKEEKDGLHVKGVKWRQGMWAKHEVDLLKKNILTYCKNHGIPDPRDVIFRQSKEERKSFYRTIAKGIQRPLFAIYRRVLRTYENGNNIGKYSVQEVELLKELRKKHGNDWSAIGLALGRSASSVKDRCRLLNDRCTTGKWTGEEERLLSNAVHQQTKTKHGESVTTGILWTNVAKIVTTRSEKQCRSKWLNYLNWKECGGKEWNKFDEIDLIKKVYDLGVDSENDINWAELANGWTSVRSPQWLRSKWWTIKKHSPSFMSFKETVAYLNSNYSKNLKHHLDHNDQRYFQIPEQQFTISGNLLSTPVVLNTSTTGETTTSSVGPTVTVDGDIFLTRSDDKGADTLEMVQLRALPNNDPTQPTSYIIEPLHCSLSTTTPSYLVQQSTTPLAAHAIRKVIGKISDNSGSQRNMVNDAVQQQDVPVVSRDDIFSESTVVTANNDESNQVMTTLSDVMTRQPTGSIQDTRSYKDIDTSERQSLDYGEEKQRKTRISKPAERNVVEVEDVTSTHTSKDIPASIHCTPDMHFSTTSDNVIYTHSLLPDLVHGNQTTVSDAIDNNEVVMPQATLPDNILQIQNDEATSFDTVITASPLALVADSLGEVTVANTATGLNTNDIIIHDDFSMS